VNIFQRFRAAFSQTYFDKYVQNWVNGNDMPGGFGQVSQETALTYAAFWACNRVLAETFASVGIHEYKKLENGDREETDDTGLHSILHNAPNDETSAYNFQECLMYQLNLGGNFVAERIMNGRKIAEYRKQNQNVWSMV
jgi:phage portal protein BeeE